MDLDVAELVRQERLIDAARLASDRGDPRTASVLYERACAFAQAAAQSLVAGEAARALELAAEGGDNDVAERAAALVARDPPVACRVAARLQGRGHDGWAARLLEGAGCAAEAARAWERAGATTRAAALLENAGDPAAAARVLEGGLRKDPRAWPIACALGALLERFGKREEAIRVLQRVPPEAPERRDALVSLLPALERLGLSCAAASVSEELRTLGGAPSKEPLAPRDAAHGRLFGRYEPLRVAASSPSARVIECVDAVGGEHVALKLFAANVQGAGRDALARFEREVRAMRMLSHPNVVPLRDFIPEGPALVLAWMPGGTLEQRLATGGPLGPARAADIAAGLLSALGDAHRLGILHRDVKPANVLFDGAGGARLSDFGVAHLGDASTTATAGVFGTLAYMSPEQRAGRPADARSDIFSVGVLLREMLTGELPNPSAADCLRPSEAHSELDERHDALVARLTAHEPALRPVDTLAARAELAALAWPKAPSARKGRQHGDEPRAWSGEGRLELGPDGSAIDQWTGRRVERVPLDDQALARARAFALADHRALQSVLRVDREGQVIWLEALAPVADVRPLTAVECAILGAALGALHAQGACHGGVDRGHLGARPSGELALRFAVDREAPAATPDADRCALGALGAGR